MIRFLRERVWGHLPTEAPLRTRLWASLLWGLALPLVLAVVRWLFHLEEGFSVEPALSAMRVTVPLAVVLPIPVVGPWIYLAILRVFSIVGFAVSHLFLVLIFYGIITPFGIALRLSGRDPLQIRQKGKAPAWWPVNGMDDRRRYYRMF